MDQPESRPKKPYEKPKVESHRVFEVSLACVKVTGQPLCNFNIRRIRS